MPPPTHFAAHFSPNRKMAKNTSFFSFERITELMVGNGSACYKVDSIGRK